MFGTKFKSSKPINLEKPLRTYITKHYDSHAYFELEGFIKDLAQNREIVIRLAEFLDLSFEKLKSYKETTVDYLNMIAAMKEKINFGKESFSIKLDFSWSDSIKGDTLTTNNINFEYFSVLYNLGVLYHLMGRFIANSNPSDDNKLKEGINYFKYSAWVFDHIKQESGTSLTSKETQTDLSMNFLSYLSFVSLAQAQALLLTFAEKKEMALELQAQLSKGVADLYSSALNLANESLKKIIDEPSKKFLNFKKCYFCGIACIKMKEHYSQVFNTTGEGYGKQIAYLTNALEYFNSASKDINRSAGVTELEILAFNDKKSDIEFQLNEMIEKNRRIYHEVVPDNKFLGKIEKNIKVNPTQIADNLNNFAPYKALDHLIPKEIKLMITNYKNQMMEYISEHLEKLENDAKISTFLADLNLPLILETSVSTQDISDYLWNKINEVQQKGGVLFLTGQINDLQRRSEEIENKIKEVEMKLYNEDQEDAKLRTLYGKKWIRQPSKVANNQFFHIINEYKGKLAYAHKIDLSINDYVMNNKGNFELLGLTRNSLQKKIPLKTNLIMNTNLSNTEEYKSLKKELELLESLKAKCMNIIDKIFQMLNEDNSVPQFLQVLDKKTNEKDIFNENKGKYDSLFKELEELSAQVEGCKKQILMKNDNFNKIKLKFASSSKSEENEKFFKKLEKYIIEYNQVHFKLSQGSNFYNQFLIKLNELNARVEDYMMARNLEKEDSVQSIARGENIKLSMHPGDDAASFLDPQFSRITNLQYSYRYAKDKDSKGGPGSY